MSFKSELAREYRAEHPDKPALALARIMYEKNKLVFKDVEDARSKLRYIEGKQGEALRGKTVKASLFFKEEARPYNPYNLPKSDEDAFEPYIISGHKRGLVINDIHLPYHNVEALTSCFDFAKKQKPDFVFINGDLLDFHQLSYFQRDPRKKRFSEELDMFKDFFQTLQKIFKCKIYYKFGNHEERYDSFLFQKAGELVGVEEFSLESIIKARAEGIEIIRDKRLVVMNDLPFIHGHEFGRGVFSPVNAARGLFMQAKHTCVKGDCHTTSEHTEPNIFGKIMTTWSVGCLCGLNPKWLPLNKWNHGLMMVDLSEDGKGFEVRNHRIYQGKVL
jgi:predicted phosphodiesterase